MLFNRVNGKCQITLKRMEKFLVEQFHLDTGINP